MRYGGVPPYPETREYVREEGWPQVRLIARLG